MPLSHEAVAELVGLAVSTPSQHAKSSAMGRIFLSQHPQLLDELELNLFTGAQELQLPRETVALVLNTMLPKLVLGIGQAASKQKVEHSGG